MKQLFTVMQTMLKGKILYLSCPSPITFEEKLLESEFVQCCVALIS